ncbi:hypothetical protein, partial [Eubacterium ventriosum]|uniref:hypothetical protein n=1 Tax=Eubacterium ventriosum TaxID=39496 RepID=UPI00399B8BFA
FKKFGVNMFVQLLFHLKQNFDFLHNMEFTPAYDFISNNFYIKIPSNKFTLTLSDGISSIYYLFFPIQNTTHFLQKYR